MSSSTEPCNARRSCYSTDSPLASPQFCYCIHIQTCSPCYQSTDIPTLPPQGNLAQMCGLVDSAHTSPSWPTCPNQNVCYSTDPHPDPCPSTAFQYFSTDPPVLSASILTCTAATILLSPTIKSMTPQPCKGPVSRFFQTCSYSLVPVLSMHLYAQLYSLLLYY